MCGIVGYIGGRVAEPVLVEGLRRLDCRDGESCGLATLTGPHLHLRKRIGPSSELADYLRARPAPGCVGIAYKGPAVDDAANDGQAQPHLSANGMVAVVHQGVVENKATLKRQLAAEGIAFRTDSDTEVIAQLIAYHLNGDLMEATRKAVGQLKGIYGMVVVSPRNPDLVVGACLDSSLVLGIGAREHLLVSDRRALAGIAQRLVPLHDSQICVLTADACQVFDHEPSAALRLSFSS